MAYSDFDLRTVREDFKLTLVEDIDLFADREGIEAGPGLRNTLKEWAPAAMAMNTEKARSGMIIAPILMEAARLSGRRINLFSGILFDVDGDRGLNGVCDYLMAKSPELFYLDRPVAAVVEAKKEDISAGLGQCLAALVAARMFNAKSAEGHHAAVFGAVTTGSLWRFLKLDGDTAWIDRPEYYLGQLPKILGILTGFAD